MTRRACRAQWAGFAFDLDLSLIEPRAATLELPPGDILAGPVDRGGFELVTAEAVLHHVADAHTAIANLAASLAPGGAILLIGPDFLPVSVAEPVWSSANGLQWRHSGWQSAVAPERPA